MSGSTYHAPEYEAGYTEEQWAEHGDAVLMTWRNWVNLRERVWEEKNALDGDHAPHEMYVAALDWVLQEMDETLP